MGVTRVELGDILARVLETGRIGRRVVSQDSKQAILLRSMARQIGLFKGELPRPGILDEIVAERRLGFAEIAAWAGGIDIFLKEFISFLPLDQEHLNKILDLALAGGGEEGQIRRGVRELVEKRGVVEEKKLEGRRVYPFVLEVRPTVEETIEKGADLLQAQLAQKPDSVIGAFTGGTAVPFWHTVAARHNSGRLDLKKVRAFINLDEYVGIPPEFQQQTYAYYMDVNFYDRLNFTVCRGRRVLPLWTTEDPVFSCQVHEDVIDAVGGIDIQFMGLGHTSHFAFCEPGTPVGLYTHVVSLDMCSRIANSRYFMTDENRAVLEIEGEGAPFPYLQIWESRPEIYARQIAHFWNVVMPRVPTHAITVGPATILEKTQKAVILAAGEGKAGAVFNVVMNSPTTLVPATLLKFHADFTVIVDLAAAAGLPSPWNKAGQYFINPLKYS